ncbi:hypothetical protein LDC_1502 [sediment metagenome]|uniref:Methyltransferase domain-containing protein n=1 Tax=sediment metagenome TaxID=749907 RepID=D9PIZ3_9ZZZZ
MNNIIIDNDASLHYEYNSLARKAMNSVLIPLLNTLPRNIRPLLMKSHKSGSDIIEHATTHKALEVLYGHGSSKIYGSFIQNFFKSIWLSTNNSKAVRNRLRLVRRELTKQIIGLFQEGREIKIVSIASGSARAILESIEVAGLDETAKLSVSFVDKNSDAILYSQDLTKDNKFKESFKWYCNTAGDFFKLHSDKIKYNIIEMVGLIDYFDDFKAIKIFSSIYNSLEPDGIMITANIDDNSERPFITKVVGWGMIYRSCEQLADLIIKAGFDENKLKIFYEPQKIHCVIVAQK